MGNNRFVEAREAIIASGITVIIDTLGMGIYYRSDFRWGEEDSDPLELSRGRYILFGDAAISTVGHDADKRYAENMAREYSCAIVPWAEVIKDD